MEAEQEKMQFLGFLGVHKESYKIIFLYRKIFTRITFALFLHLSIFFLIRILVTHFFFTKTIHDSDDLTQPLHQILLDMISDWPSVFLIILFFSLHYTSEVVYTIVSFYTNKEVTFYNVTTFVPEVWKRLVATFLCTAFAFFIINVLAALVIAMWKLTIGESSGRVAIVVVIVTAILYFAGSVYLTAVWLLASVVTVLEDSYGFEATVKSKELIKGKMGLSIMIALKLNVLFFIILFFFTMVVVNGWELLGLGLMERTVFAIVCFVMLSHLLLLMLVIQTVLYFVCKSYHHEIVDMSVLPDHVEVYQREDYEQLKAKDVRQDYQV